MKHEEIVALTARFTRQMQRELVVNNEKKGDSWKQQSVGDLYQEIIYHADKLDAALASEDREGVREHTADIAIYALFLAKSAGAI